MSASRFAFTPAVTGEVTSRLRAPTARRQRELVAAAEALLENSRSGRIALGAICDELGVGRRTLHEAFAACYGCSPALYLRQRRLDQARRALLGAAPGTCCVKGAALAHGFFHLGRFAAAYRARFGEAPSHTLADQARAA